MADIPNAKSIGRRSGQGELRVVNAAFVDVADGFDNVDTAVGSTAGCAVVAVVVVGESLRMSAGVTGPVPSAFCHAVPVAICAVETGFHPLETMSGYEAMKMSISSSEISCSRMMRPGDLGPGAQRFRAGSREYVESAYH
jgi:hypothetical protein